jgi:hypothetical protein
MEMCDPVNKPCENCPWRLANQGKRTPWGFYTKTNLRRLWGQIRRGGGQQSCHPTDPSHPDHIAAGAKEGSKARECPGSVILVLRELKDASNESSVLTPESMNAYLKTRKNGITKSGFRYWILERIQMGGVPYFGGPKLPSVDVDDPEVGLPEELARG